MRRRCRLVHDLQQSIYSTMKNIVCLFALLLVVGLASAGYISHGWSSPMVVRRVYVPRYSGWSGGYGRSGGYGGGWSGGYGGWSGGYSGGYGGGWNSGWW